MRGTNSFGPAVAAAAAASVPAGIFAYLLCHFYSPIGRNIVGAILAIASGSAWTIAACLPNSAGRAIRIANYVAAILAIMSGASQLP